MNCGIVGLPGVGKTTLFSALTGAAVEGYSDKPNLGMARIPDPRLGTIAEYVTTQKIVPATIQLVDIPGVPAGSDTKRLNSFLTHVREVDVLCEVVRASDFSGIGPPDPTGDIDKLDTDFVLADMIVAESARDKASRAARTGDPDVKARLPVLERVCTLLDEGKPIRVIDDWDEAARGILKSYGFITSKPVLYVANVGEDDLGGDEPATAVAVREHAEATGGQAVTISAKLEAELAELGDESQEMLESLGLTEPAIGPLARAINRLLGLAYFYTAGDKEVRAWTIQLGANAPEAAGSIHSDIQRGFIRAECYSVDDLVQHKTEKAIRDAGRLRSEGKSYEIQDGDVVHFLFNV